MDATPPGFRPYRPVSASASSKAQRDALRRIVRRHEWAESRTYADGGAEVLVLDRRGIITQIIEVDRYGRPTEGTES